MVEIRHLLPFGREKEDFPGNWARGGMVVEAGGIRGRGCSYSGAFNHERNLESGFRFALTLFTLLFNVGLVLVTDSYSQRVNFSR